MRNSMWPRRLFRREERSGPYRPCGHTHFWDRAASRRDVLKTIAGGGALALTTGLWNPTALLAGSSTVAPNPIPAGIKFEGELFHVFPPAPGVEIATITDFVGTIGATAVQGTGVGVNHDGQSMILNFGADMRFMRGLYIGVDGRPHQATFGFI
jgi:hypothetical protein